MSKVGVFWGYNGTVIAGTTLLQDAVDDGLFVNSSYSHAIFWKTVRNQYNLQMFEYEEIPRGRVLFSKEEGLFFVYLDKILLNKSFKCLILKEFDLLESIVKFKRDAHYTTNKKEIYQLLNSI